MNLRKLISLLMTAVMLLGMIPVGHAELTNCNHDWDWRFPNGEPKHCQEERLMEMYCTVCGLVASSYPVTGDHTPGSWHWDGTPPANCYEWGIQNQSCALCGDLFNEREVQGEHKWSGYVTETPAGCETPGEEVSSCSVCGEKGSSREIPPTGHDWGDWKLDVAATCNREGLRVRYCKRCNHREEQEVPAGNHQWGSYVTETPAGCETPGEEVSYCSICGEKGSYREIPPTGHDWGAWKLDVEATCTREGLRVRYCKRCNHREEQEVPAGNHQWGDPIPYQEGNCIQKEQVVRYCYVCGSNKLEILDYGPHNYGDWYVVKQPSYTEDGLEECVCSVCKDVMSRIIPMLDMPTAVSLSIVGDASQWVEKNETKRVQLRITNLGMTVVDIYDIQLDSRDGVTATLTQSTPDVLTCPSSGAVKLSAIGPGETYDFYVDVFQKDSDILNESVLRLVWISGVAKETGDMCSSDITIDYPIVLKLGVQAELANAPANGMYFVPGENAQFNITYSNPALYQLTGVQVKGSVLPVADYSAEAIETKALSAADTLAALASGTAGYTYTVTAADAQRGSIQVMASAESAEIPAAYSAFVTVPCGFVRPENAVDFTIDVQLANQPANGYFFVPGETVHFDVTYANPNTVNVAGVYVDGRCHPRQPGEVMVDVANHAMFAAGQSATGTFSYVVTEADAALRSVAYDATLWGGGGEYLSFSKTYSFATGFEDGTMEIDLALAKGAKNHAFFVEGETVELVVTYSNPNGYNVPNVYIDGRVHPREANEIKSPVASHAWVLANQTFTGAFTYTITKADVENGYVMFDAALWGNGGKYLAFSKIVTIATDKEDGVLNIDVQLTNLPANGKHFVPGETAEFAVTYSNPNQYSVFGAYIDGRIHPRTEKEITTDVANHDVLKGSDSFTGTFSYVVTEEDAELGSVTYDAPIWANGGACLFFSPTYSFPAGPELMLDTTIEVLNAPQNGTHFVKNEIVNYRIATTNISNEKLSDTVLSYMDDMGPVALEVVKNLEPGETFFAYYNYTVTAADVANGAHYACGYAEGTINDKTVSDDSETISVPCGPGELPDDYQAPGSVMLTLIEWGGPDNGTHYVPGEKIFVYHRLSNNSSDVTMTVDHEHYFQICGDGIKEKDDWLYSKVLLPGTSYGVYFWTPTVTEADAARGYVEKTSTFYLMGDDGNEYTATGSVRLPCGPGELPDDYVPPFNPDIDEDGIPNEEDPDIDGDGIPNGDDPDVDGDGISNDEDNDDDGDGIPDDEDRMPSGNVCGVILIKTVESTPANGLYYVPGEEIEFLITAKNNADKPLDVVVLTDPLSAYFYHELTGIPAGGSDGRTLNYVVTEYDAEIGSVVNYAYGVAYFGEKSYSLISNTVTVPVGEADTDGDGIPNDEDPDVDGDGIPNGSDPDVDGDGIPNGEDPDVDGDGIPNGEDPDVDGDGIPNGEDPDVDGDGIPNGEDPDADGDGIPNGTDPDENGDGKPEDPFGVLTGMEIIKSVESLPMNGSFYTEGETVAYKITYTNSGETELINVAIYDAMSGLAEVASAEKLTPGESRMCFFNHTVTAADVARGYIANTAVGEYEVGGYSASVNSNTVMVDTDGKEDNAAVPPLFGDDDEGNYDPSTGWTDDPAAGEDGESFFGVIDTDQLRSGETHCAITITGRDNASVSYEISFCAAHAATQASALAASNAAALWRTEVESAYQKLLAAADPTAQAVLLTEYIRFVTDLNNYEALLNALYPDQPALVAGKIADMWQDKCVALCHEMHTLAADRKDSLLSVEAASGAVANVCGCDITLEENGKKAFTQTYCPVHGSPYSMMDMLLGGKDTAETWAAVHQIWGVELTNAYSEVAVKLGDNSAAAKAGYAVMTQWMMAREASLIALYPENPELVAQTMVKLIMDRVNNLCLTGK